MFSPKVKLFDNTAAQGEKVISTLEPVLSWQGGLTVRQQFNLPFPKETTKKGFNAYPVVHGPGSVILEYVVDCSQLLELFLCLRVLVRMDHHGLLLVLPLDLLSRGIDADIHQLVEGSIDRVNLRD